MTLKKFYPNIKPEIEDVLWHGFDGSVVVINGKQEWVKNRDAGLPVRKRAKKYKS